MGRLAAIQSKSAVIVTLLVAVVPARAASADAFVTAAADSFHALSRIEEALDLVPLTDDELAHITDPRTPRKARPTSSVRRRQLPDASEVSRSVEDPSAQGPGASKDGSVTVESGDETRPRTRDRSVAREPVPDTTVVSPPVHDPGAQGRRAEESSGVTMEHGGESASPNTKGRSAVEEEPDPRAIIDWLLKEYLTRIR